MSLAIGLYQSVPMNSRLDAEAEQVLIEQCRRQNFEAFGQIVDAYQGRVFGFVKRMIRDSDDALDITQEVFVKAFQAIGRFDGRSSLRTWLFRIAHNLCIDKIRRSGKSQNDVSLENEFGDRETQDVSDSRWNPEQLMLNEELAKIVEDGLASMSEKLRGVLWLHDGEDMSYEDIALTLNIPVGTVKSRLFLARTHLKNAIDAYRQEATR